MRFNARRQALLFELLPIVGGFVALLIAPLTFWLERRHDAGKALSSGELALWLPVAVPLLVALFLFAFSGIGWMMMDRVVIGVAFFIGRAAVSLNFILWALGGSEGDSWHDPVSQQNARTTFAVATAIATASVLALAFSTRHKSTTSQS